jgi:hypothetical protein
VCFGNLMRSTTARPVRVVQKQTPADLRSAGVAFEAARRLRLAPCGASRLLTRSRDSLALEQEAGSITQGVGHGDDVSCVCLTCGRLSATELLVTRADSTCTTRPPMLTS